MLFSAVLCFFSPWLGLIRRDTYTGIPVLGPGTEESWIHFHIDGKEGMMMMYSEYSEYSLLTD